VTRGEPVERPSKTAVLPLVVYGDFKGENAIFIASGYMGDATSLKITSSDEYAPSRSDHVGVPALRIGYEAKGANGWAGVYWQTPANNWGKIKGAGYDVSDAKALTFWIRGEKGGEFLADVKVGGITGPYPDSGMATLGSVRLTPNWERYTISLEGKDMTHVVGGFAFLIRRTDNPRGAAFYLDDIRFVKDPNEDMVAAAPAPKPTALEVEGSSETLRKSVLILADKEEFKRSLKAQLSDFVARAKENRALPIRIEGHTDSIGSDEVNLKLSEERAMMVAEFLEDQGLNRKRFTVVGLGKANPISVESNNTREGRQKNRRVELVLGEQ
jgi:outer membrane protein OmpA-like peptidoglycan-associated protein